MNEYVNFFPVNQPTYVLLKFSK